MNLDESKIPAGCKVKYIKKMYYSKYIYKLTLEIDKAKLIKTNNMAWRNIRHASYSNRFQLVNELVNELKPVIKDDNYRIRAENCKVSFFTNNVDDVNSVILKFPGGVTELEKPMNTNHAEIIDKFRKVVVRQTLFDKKYKFKVYLRYGFDLRENRYKDVQEFLQNLDSNWGINHTLDRFFNTKASTRHVGYTAAVYLNNTEDLMMFQLRFNNDINKIEEAILLNEL